MIINQLQPRDFNQWLPLWQANTENSLSAEITAETWRRICDPASPVGGIAARFDASAPLSGICHYILHPTTGNSKLICYMQDLYVDPAVRLQGMARKLVTYLAAMGAAEDWSRIYWLAEADNQAAQALYKTLGYKLNFTLHVLPIQ